MDHTNLAFVRAYFEARKFAEASGLDPEQSKAYAVADARREVSALVASIV